MADKKVCSSCGELFVSILGDTLCSSCKVKRHNNEISRQISDGEIEETSFESIIFCPWCGEIHETEDDDYELYSDGEHKCYCGFCEKDFIVNTYVSHSFSTRKQYWR